MSHRRSRPSLAVALLASIAATAIPGCRASAPTTALPPTPPVAAAADDASAPPPAVARPPRAARAGGDLAAADIRLLSTDMLEVRLTDVVEAPALVLYYSTGCPHCWNVAAEFQQLCDDLAPHGVQCAAVASAASRLGTVREYALQTGLVSARYVDYGGAYRDTFEMVSTPTALYFDGRGDVVLRADPFYRGAALAVAMTVAEVQGRDPATAWEAGRYYGPRACSPCHEVAYNSWLLSPHAVAIQRLPDGAHLDPACLACHATAVGQPGGFVDLVQTSHLRDVGCEACHGPGGGHAAPGVADAARADPRARCARCHDADHAVALDVDALVAGIDHQLAGTLPREQWNGRRLAVEEGRFERIGLRMPAGSCVGSQACAACHADTVAAWAAGPHGTALQTLVAQGSQTDETCLTCHVPTTPCDEPAAARAREPGVSCEACHGAGGDHVASGGQAPPSGLRSAHAERCVVEPSCRVCHTDVRDADWSLETRLAGVHP